MFESVTPVSLHSALSGVPVAVLEGALVLAPRPASLPRLGRLTAPAWAAVLPATIIVGTFGMLVVPAGARVAVLLAALTTPLLALIAVASVARARWAVAPAALIAAALTVLATGPAERLGAGVITALACLTVGAVLARLIPGRWLLAGVLAMSAVDVLLLATGFGYHQDAILAAAGNSFHGPRFTGARVGATTIGYPDLLLAGLLGAAVADHRGRRLVAALLVTAMAIAMDSLLRPGEMLPATVPLALTLVLASGSRLLERNIGAPDSGETRAAPGGRIGSVSSRARSLGGPPRSAPQPANR